MALEPRCYTPFLFFETMTSFSLTAESEQKSSSSLEKGRRNNILTLASDSAVLYGMRSILALCTDDLHFLSYVIHHSSTNTEQLAQLCCYKSTRNET